MGDAITSLWLVGGRVAVSSAVALRADIEIVDGRIRRIVYGNSEEVPRPEAATTVNVDGYLILPGLINAHDHLEFNLFPRLGRGPYPNSEAWARDICHPDCSPVREHLSVPKNVRLWWGGLKNLLSGVTTVCHHNPYDPLFDEGFPVCVVRRFGWAHSMVFGDDVVGAFDATDRDLPFVIHLGEGTDEGSQDEVFALDRKGALDSRTILVHGVAFTESGHALWQQRGAGLVWCPTSNRFTLGATLDVRFVSRLEKVALGSDSALTARGDLLDEIRAAHDEEGAPADLVYRMVTESAARMLRLNDGEGRVQPGSAANLVAIPWNNELPADAVVKMNMAQVEMVLISGELRLASLKMVMRWPSLLCEGLEWISVGGLERCVRAPVSWLLSETNRHLSGAIHLAGRRISA